MNVSATVHYNTEHHSPADSGTVQHSTWALAVVVSAM